MKLGRAMKRLALDVAEPLLVLGSLLAPTNRRKLRRAHFVASMFSGREQVEHFRNMDAIFPTRRIGRAGRVHTIARGAALELPQTYVFDGDVHDSTRFLAETDTTGLIVVHDGQAVYERYWRGNDENTRWISWSVGKSFVSALVGIAIRDRLIGSIDDPLIRYAPELVNTAYDGVSVRHALQMSSGVRWSEDYSDTNSDVIRFGRSFAFGGSLVAFAKTLVRENEPGTYNRYNSLDVQVLGLVLANVTGKSLAEYLTAEIWSRIGATQDAYWILDDYGTEFAAGGINATLRDYCRFGMLYLQQGCWNGEQLIPREWVRDSHTPDAPHLFPGRRTNAASVFGYGYLWWIPDRIDGPYAAMGIYNQIIYIDEARNLVIAKTSANRNFAATNTESSLRELETIAFFRAIADKASTR